MTRIQYGQPGGGREPRLGLSMSSLMLLGAVTGTGANLVRPKSAA